MSCFSCFACGFCSQALSPGCLLFGWNFTVRSAKPEVCLVLQSTAEPMTRVVHVETTSRRCNPEQHMHVNKPHTHQPGHKAHTTRLKQPQGSIPNPQVLLLMLTPWLKDKTRPRDNTRLTPHRPCPGTCLLAPLMLIAPSPQ